jgi:hypothetical protein
MYTLDRSESRWHKSSKVQLLMTRKHVKRRWKRRNRGYRFGVRSRADVFTAVIGCSVWLVHPDAFSSAHQPHSSHLATRPPSRREPKVSPSKPHCETSSYPAINREIYFSESRDTGYPDTRVWFSMAPVSAYFSLSCFPIALPVTRDST